MAYEIINKLRGPSIVRVTSATATGFLPLTAFSANTALENVTGLIITSFKYSLANGENFLLQRGGVEVGRFFGNGDWKHDEHGIANNKSGTFAATVSGLGTAIITLRKEATYNVDVEKL